MRIPQRLTVIQAFDLTVAAIVEARQLPDNRYGRIKRAERAARKAFDNFLALRALYTEEMVARLRRDLDETVSLHVNEEN